MQRINIRIRPPVVVESIFIGNRIQKQIINRILANKYDSIIFVVDKNLLKWHKNYIDYLFRKTGACEIIFFNPELHYKDFDHCEHLLKRIIVHQLNRNSCLVAIGGGYVADMTGYIASIFMRGIDFIQIPTTMMSMSDAIVGKVAINYHGYKNLLGTFYSPKFVFIDTVFLDSLPDIERVFGLVEIWKHILLIKNKIFLQELISYLSDITILNDIKIISFSLKTKAHFVKTDFHDRTGKHKALSLGHTLANYLEANHALRHGPAVLYGIVFTALLSNYLKMLSNRRLQDIIQTANLFERKIGMLKDIQNKLRTSVVLHELQFDKINQGNSYTFVLLTNRGYFVKKDIHRSTLIKVLKIFKEIRI